MRNKPLIFQHPLSETTRAKTIEKQFGKSVSGPRGGKNSKIFNPCEGGYNHEAIRHHLMCHTLREWAKSVTVERVNKESKSSLNECTTR